MADLRREIERYEELLPSLVGQEGRFALICERDLGGTYAAYDDALKTGYEKFGLKPFLVKKISVAETLAHFTRDLVSPCRT